MNVRFWPLADINLVIYKMNLVSEKTKELVEKFYPTDSETVVLQLQDYCDYLSEIFGDKALPENYERFCFAVLKLGESSKEKLNKAVELGKIDYRDLLVSAGFANSLTIHNEWADKILDLSE